MRETHDRSDVRTLAVAGLLALPLAVIGCDQTSTSQRSEPSVTAPSVPPSPPPPIPSTPNVFVTGTVSGDGQALPNVRVEVRLVDGRSHGRVDVRTDASGRYRAEVRNSSSLQVLVTAYHDRYQFQPCAAGFEQSEPGPPERSADVRLSSAEGLAHSTPRVPDRRNISGTIYTLTSTGKEPVPDAYVLWDLTNDDFQASTKTDASGRFTLCGLPVNSTVLLFALRGAYSTYEQGWLSVGPDGGDVDVELIVKRP